MKKITNILLCLLLVAITISCSDDKSTSPNDENNGTGSNDPTEKIIYTEFDYNIKSDLTGQVITESFYYNEESSGSKDFFTSTSFYEMNNELHWEFNNISEGQSKFAMNFVTPIDEMKVGEYNLDKEEQSDYNSIVYHNGLNNDGSKATKSYFHIRTLKKIQVNSVDYALISGTGVMYLDLFFDKFEESVFYINFENVKVKIVND